MVFGVHSLPASQQGKGDYLRSGTDNGKDCRRAFPKARLVSDRFHVQQLTGDAVQQLCIQYRREAIDQENRKIELVRETKNTYIAQTLKNSDTIKQMLARSRHLLFKQDTNWTPSQRQREELLFHHYP